MSQYIKQTIEGTPQMTPVGNPTPIDTVPTENSTHLVTSGGVYDAIEELNSNYIEVIGTGTTLSDKLSSLYSTYNGLSDIQKVFCYLNYNGAILRIGNINVPTFVGGTMNSSGVGVAFRVRLGSSSSLACSITVSTSGSVTYTNDASSTDTPVSLWYKN